MVITMTGHESDSRHNREEPTEFSIEMDIACHPEDVLSLQDETVKRIKRDVIDYMNRIYANGYEKP